MTPGGEINVAAAFEKICERVYRVGGGDLSAGADCLVYALDLGEPVLIDCGSGAGWPRIKKNIRAAGIEPDSLHTLLLTHAHIDHIGAAARIRRESGCRVVAHQADAAAITSGDPRFSVAHLYGVDLEPCPVDLVVSGEQQRLPFSEAELLLLHTPGHTPGSLAAVLDLDGTRVLFGQDIHGPFSSDFGSDLEAWRASMRKLLDLEADILCEGHFGVFRPAPEVKNFIEGQLAAPKAIMPVPG